jgi:hypothetical protein
MDPLKRVSPHCGFRESVGALEAHVLSYRLAALNLVLCGEEEHSKEGNMRNTHILDKLWHLFCFSCREIMRLSQ